jgi:hypothetical protein
VKEKIMSRIGPILFTLLGLTTAHFHVFAEDFDGSKTLLGTVIKIGDKKAYVVFGTCTPDSSK